MKEGRGSFGVYSVSESGSRSFYTPCTQEMLAIDRETIANGISGIELMERAGQAVCSRIESSLQAGHPIVVLCGPGNNGGDGLVISQKLVQKGFQVCTVLVASRRYSPECLEQLNKTAGVYLFIGNSVATDCPLDGLAVISASELCSRISQSAVVIDALLGTGQQDAPRGAILEVVDLLQGVSSRGGACQIVSVDIPTGINGDTGSVHTPHVVANRTIAIQHIKRGMLQFPARTSCGAIETTDIGIVGTSRIEYSVVNRENLPAISPRVADAHKGMFGRVLVVGGSLAMPGAATLAALGALRTGAGIVSRCTYRGWMTMPPLVEAMFEVLPGDETTYGANSIDRVVQLLPQYDVCILGPGIGTNSSTADFVCGVLSATKSLKTRCIIDADALNIIAMRRFSLEGVPAIITPHPAEAGRLLGVSTQEVQNDRFVAARELASRYKAVAVLKGVGSLVHSGERGSIIAEGTPYLATPGSGDVLAGILAACVSRTVSLEDAAILGGWIHARAGVIAARNRQGPILASEIADSASSIIGALESSWDN